VGIRKRYLAPCLAHLSNCSPNVHHLIPQINIQIKKILGILKKYKLSKINT
jgi:hypothetical protein